MVQIGPQLVALEAWNELGLTSILQDLNLPSDQIATAQLTVANRLIQPLSEWALIEWANHTALPELLDIRITKTNKDRLYYISDDLLTHRVVIETKLRNHERDLFSLGRSVIFTT